MKILITGASRGLGASLALRFSSMRDTELFLVSRSELKLKGLKARIHQQFSEAKVHVLPFDLAVEKSIVELVDTIKGLTDRMDILINNAGLLIRADFEQISKEDAMRLFEVNYLAPAMLIRHSAGLLRKAERPHIINISSMGGFQGSIKFPGLSHYSASKAAIASLTECLAAEFKGEISVNCLAIGSVQTEMLQEAFPGYKAPVNPDEMAEFIMDFALNAHRFMNGKIIPVALSNP